MLDGKHFFIIKVENNKKNTTRSRMVMMLTVILRLVQIGLKCHWMVIQL